VALPKAKLVNDPVTTFHSLPFRINEALCNGDTLPGSISQSLSNPPVNVVELRERYAAAIVDPLVLRARNGAGNAGEAPNLVVVEEEQKEQPAQIPQDDSISDSSAEEEHEAMDEDELLADVDEDDPNLDDSSIPLMTALWKKSRKMKNFMRLLISYLTSPHSISLPIFALIKEAFSDLDNIPCTMSSERHAVFCLLVDLFEDGDDPFSPLSGGETDLEFLDEVTQKAQGFYGLNDITTIKLWLLKIFYATDRRSEIVKFVETGITAAAVRDLFATEVPSPQSGVGFVDRNLSTDGIRAVRYLYMVALVQQKMGKYMMAKHFLMESVSHSLRTFCDPTYREIRGSAGITMLAVNHVGMLLDAADLTQDLGLPTEPLSYISQVCMWSQ